jgi:3-methyladenine DNA glycosylase AlkD
VTPSRYIQGLRSLFRQHGDPATALGQAAYMKDHFPFYGLKTPERNALLKEYVADHGIPAWGGPLEETVRLAWDEEQREMHYAALFLLEKVQRGAGPELIDLLEELILANSWWDSVDWIAKLTGIHFKKYPDQAEPVTKRWMDSGELWLQRVAIIHQLSYRDRTDTERLFRYIRRVAGSKEFFLQKAAGWALRQYARTDPQAVLRFLEKENLPALTVREARKHLT